MKILPIFLLFLSTAAFARQAVVFGPQGALVVTKNLCFQDNTCMSTAGGGGGGGGITTLTGEGSASGSGSVPFTLGATIAGAKTFSTSLMSPIFKSSTASPSSAGAFRLAVGDLLGFRDTSNTFNNTIGISNIATGVDAFLFQSSTAATGGVLLTGDLTQNQGAVLAGQFGGGDQALTTNFVIAGSPATYNFVSSNDSGGSAVKAAAWAKYSTDSSSAQQAFLKARGTAASSTIVSSGDGLGNITAFGYDGTDFKPASRISFNVDATPGASDMPGNIVFSVTPDGSATLGTALTIANTKAATFVSSVGATTLNSSTLTASTALASDGSKNIVSSGTTATELGFLSGVTSAVQTQINTKAPSASPTFTGTINTPLTASRVIVTDGSSNLAASTTTSTELGFVHSNTTALQNLSGTNSGDVTLASVGAAPANAGASLSGQVLTLQPFDGTHPGVVPSSGGGTTNFLRADGTFAAPPGGGTIGSNWVSWTPTFVGLGTVTSVTAYSRRNGPNLEGRVKFTTGTCTAVVASMTLGFNGVNSAVTIASTGLASGTNEVGKGAYGGAATSSLIVLGTPADTLVNFAIQSTAGLTAGNGSTVFFNAGVVSIEFSIPISGWNWDS